MFRDWIIDVFMDSDKGPRWLVVNLDAERLEDYRQEFWDRHMDMNKNVKIFVLICQVNSHQKTNKQKSPTHHGLGTEQPTGHNDFPVYIS